MKKLLTTCALVALGGLAAIAAPKTEKLTGTLTKGKSKSVFFVNTDSGDKIRVFAWKKMQDRLKKQKIVKNEKKAEFVVFKNKQDNYVVKNFEVE